METFAPITNSVLLSSDIATHLNAERWVVGQNRLDKAMLYDIFVKPYAEHSYSNDYLLALPLTYDRNVTCICASEVCLSSQPRLHG